MVALYCKVEIRGKKLGMGDFDKILKLESPVSYTG